MSRALFLSLLVYLDDASHQEGAVAGLVYLVDNDVVPFHHILYVAFFVYKEPIFLFFHLSNPPGINDSAFIIRFAIISSIGK